MRLRVDPARDARQLIERKAGAVRGVDDGVERFTPVPLPNQGVSQFFASASTSAFCCWSTTPPA
jgi:hypothetical protein